MGCLLDRSQQWAVRCMHEAATHSFNSFVTLTYDDKNLPDGGTLRPDHLKAFLKRLRKEKLFSEISIKYFACGEYGDENKRPHYHAILFGIDFPDKRPYKKNKRGDMLFTSEHLEKIWRFGKCWLGSVTYQSAGYVARYTLKKAGKQFDAGHYQKLNLETGEIIDVHPEFQRMSRRPGIGHAFYERFKSDIYPSDEVIVEGKSLKPPRYYDRLLERENPARLAKVKIHREAAGNLHSDNRTTARLRVRETVKNAAIQSLKRN